MENKNIKIISQLKSFFFSDDFISSIDLVEKITSCKSIKELAELPIDYSSPEITAIYDTASKIFSGQTSHSYTELLGVCKKLKPVSTGQIFI